MATDIWPCVHAERQALADDLGSLTDQQWAMPSLCSRWNVEQLLGHMTAAAKMTPAGFFANMLKSGFKFDAMADKLIAAETAAGPQATLAEFRGHVTDTTSPPGPKATWIGETVLHAEDIRRPLGIAHDYDPEAVRRVAEFYKNSNAIVGAKNRIAGLRMLATDADWSTGDGPEVSGPLLSLAMAMTGRTATLDDLTGDGVDTLRARSCA